MANYRTIADTFQNEGIVVPTLRALVADSQFYTVMVLQPAGNLVYRNDYVGHADQPAATEYFKKYFAVVGQTQPDIVITPEYSCTWDALLFALVATPPTSGKLWIIGCEAISRERLIALKAEHNQIKWIHEELPHGPGFFDIVAYATQTTSTDGQPCLAIVLQLKTQPMVDREEDFERQNLIPGTTIYIWHNPNDLIRLITLICSDVLIEKPLTSDQCRFDRNPFLIIHPQLNTDPRHTNMRAYREQVFTSERGFHGEVITLNWAKGFVFNGQTAKASRYGASTIYTRSDKYDRSEERVHANHSKGLYYNFWECHKTNLCALNYGEHIFLVRMPKVSNVGPAALTNRTGPLMLRTWNYKDDQWTDPIIPEDEFASLLQQHNTQDCNFFETAGTTCVDRERLYAISTGNIRPSLWPTIESLTAFYTESDERLNRITFCQDPHIQSIEERDRCIGEFIHLYTKVLTAPENFPDCIASLRDNWTPCLPSKQNDFRHNIIGPDGMEGATVMFLGFRQRSYAQKLWDSLSRLWEREKTRRIVIWYMDQGLKATYSPLPTITDTSGDPASIDR